MKKERLYIGLALLFAVLFGFALEMVKVNINYVLETSYRVPGYYNLDETSRLQAMEAVRIDAPYDYYHNHTRIAWIYSLSQPGLEKLKWAVTFIGVGVFLLLHLALVKWVTHDRKMIRWTFWLYLAFFILSFGIYVFGRITGTLPQAYGVSRKIAGALQSLVPLMLLIPGWWLWTQTMKYEKK